MEDRTVRVRSLLLLGVLVLAPTPSVAQGPLDCFECDFEVTTLDWNGSATPGGFASGRFEIRNTGESADSYRIRVTTTNESWDRVEADPETISEVAPGAGLFASEDDSATFEVRVQVPDAALAGSNTSVRIHVESENEDGLDDEVLVEARALQVHGWMLDCTPQASIQKSKETSIGLTATNTGNGRDRATVTFTPAQGLAIPDPRAFERDAGASGTQVVTVGAGLRAEDGTTQVRWDLRSGGDPDATAACTTTFEITGGAGNETDGDDTEDSPLTLPPLLLGVSALLLWVRRRHGVYA